MGRGSKAPLRRRRRRKMVRRWRGREGQSAFMEG